jgi:hypothetical protein
VDLVVKVELGLALQLRARASKDGFVVGKLVLGLQL